MFYVNDQNKLPLLYMHAYIPAHLLSQNLEDNMKKNVLRSIGNDTLFQGRELDDVFTVFKV